MDKPTDEVLDEFIDGFQTDWLETHSEPMEPRKVTNELGHNMYAKYKESGEQYCIDWSIAAFQRSLILSDYESRPFSLNNLATTLITRYERYGDLEDLKDAISSHLENTTLWASDDPNCFATFVNLGNALYTAYKRLDKAEDLEEAISFHRQALSLQPLANSQRAQSLDGLANDLVALYDATGKIDDLQQGLTLRREALSIRKKGHPYRFHSLSNTASTVAKLFDQTGQIELLDEAVGHLREAALLIKSTNPARSEVLNNLASALHTQYRTTGGLQLLDESISIHRIAISLRPPGHPNRSSSLTNLGSALRSRYHKLGQQEDLEECIVLYRELPSLHCSENRPKQASTSTTYANALKTRFKVLGDFEDLQESISIHRESLTSGSTNERNRTRRLLDLASALQTRYNHTGIIEDLERVVSLQREALEVQETNQIVKSEAMTDLGISLHNRFRRWQLLADLDNSIACCEDALRLLPCGHPSRSYTMNNLACALKERYYQLNDIEDLEKCIEFHRTALINRPAGHVGRYTSLFNLASALEERFTALQDESDLNEAINCHKEALSLLPENHPDRPGSLNNSANTLRMRYTLNLDEEDWELTFTFVRSALKGFSADHIGHIHCHMSLAHLYRVKGHHDNADAEFELAVAQKNASLKTRLEAALEWSRAVSETQYASQVKAYRHAFKFLDQFLAMTPNLELQQNFLAITRLMPKSFASNAVAAAISVGDVETAVELFEGGRALLMTQLGGYRSPVDDLRNQYPNLAKRFEELSLQLDGQSTNLSPQQFSLESQIDHDQLLKSHRIIRQEWEETVQEIRSMEGFSTFLSSRRFQELQTVAAEGPVILVNCSNIKRRSDAIIIQTGASPVLVPLRQNFVADCQTQTELLYKSLRDGDAPRILTDVLRLLWEGLVQPVKEQLDAMGIKKGSRIWWCPTGVLCSLPIHAAGPYSKGERNLPDLYISSYISTMSQLIKARNSETTKISQIADLLAIGHSGGNLLNVDKELAVIRSLENITPTIISEEQATRETVLDKVPQHRFVHFACHGHVMQGQPFRSYFQLHNDTSLSLLNLVKAQLPNAEFAFLAACHSAAGSTDTPNEIIHLSAALQFCGFRSVVGTLWAMVDDDGPDVARDFYGQMGQRGYVCRNSAEALHFAVREMRKRRTPLQQWVNFVHFGV